MLEIEHIDTFYGLSHILFDLSLKVDEGQVVCLLGRNGAGKTTTLKSVMGLTPPKKGTIRFKGEDVTGRQPYQMSRKGVGYVPDDRRIFADLTVAENLEIAARKPSAGKGWDQQRLFELFPALGEIPQRKGGLLSGGEQKMLAIARALMTNPEFLLLDEPTAGMSPEETTGTMALIRRLADERGLTILFCEHDMDVVFNVASSIMVMRQGETIIQGPPETVRANAEVQQAYLGETT